MKSYIAALIILVIAIIGSIYWLRPQDLASVSRPPVNSASRNDIPSDWKTYQSEGDSPYTIRYPSEWRVLEESGAPSFWTVDGSGRLDDRIVSVIEGFVREYDPDQPKTRTSNGINEVAYIVPWSEARGYGSTSYEMILLRQDPPAVRTFDLMVASFKTLDY